MEINPRTLLHPDLRHFQLVVAEQGFSKAAEKAGVQQAALSKAVARLERDFGGPLLVRRRSGPELTSLGRKLMSMADAWAEQFLVFQRNQMIHKQDEEPEGIFRFGANQSLALSHFPSIWKALREAYPKVDLRIELGRSIEITRRVLNRDLDLGLVVNPTRRPELVIRPLMTERVFLYGPAGAVAGKSRESLPIVFNPTMIKIETVLRKFSQSPLYAVADYDLIALMAIRAGVLAILPETVAGRHPGLDLADSRAIFRANINIVYRPENLKTTGGQAVLATIKKMVART